MTTCWRATDIVDVIGERITLKKAGRNHQALCPFHKEKSPSFSTSQDKQFYYCFGCGASGNAVGFVMDFDHIDFPEAVENLARRAGMEVPREKGAMQKRERYDTLYQILGKSADWYQQQLKDESLAKAATDYLHKRGLNQETIARFKIGYAPVGWDNLIESLGNTPERQKLLLDAGLVVENEERKSTYDRFRNRIIFPIHDQRGRVIAFGGRVLGDDKPKYLNSPETPVFHKGRELYGLYEARQANRNLEQVLVVEGYMDVIALAQQGITNAVATLGTSTSADHLNQLFRHTSQITFCFDGDNAGRQAAWRALENALPVMDDGKQMRFLFLPQGEDPDSLVRTEGADAFLKRLKDKRQALPLDDYFFRHFEQEIDTTTLDGKARLVHKVTPYINKLPESSFRRLMMKKLGELSDLSADEISSVIHSSSAPAQPQPFAQPETYDNQQPTYNRSPQSPGKGQPSGKKWSGNARQPFPSGLQVKLGPAQRALRLLLAQPDLAELVYQQFKQKTQSFKSADDDLRFLSDLAESLHRNPTSSSYGVLGSWYGTRLGERLKQLMATDMPTSNARHVMEQCLLHLVTDESSDSEVLSDRERLKQAASRSKHGWIARKQNQQGEHEKNRETGK